MSHGGTAGVTDPPPRPNDLDNDGLSHCPGGADGFGNEFLSVFVGARGSRDTEVRPGPEIPAGKCKFFSSEKLQK